MIPPTVHPFLLGLLKGINAENPAIPSPEDEAWEAISREAIQHGLTHILFKWLRESDPAHRSPAPLFDWIKEAAFTLAAYNLLLAQELASILRAFEEKKIACAMVRGMALAEQLYGDITVRPMGDIDLLVRKNDLPAVRALLQDRGFCEIDRRPGFAEAYSYTLEFVKDRRGWIIVEPHWTIAYPPFADRVDMEAVWSRCIKGHVVGVDTWLLGVEDLVVHLALHLLHREDDAPLQWFYELDRVIRRSNGNLDWDLVVQTARQSAQGPLLSEAFKSIRQLFASPIPEEVFAQLDASSSHDPCTAVTSAGRRRIDHRIIRLLAAESGIDGRESLALFLVLKGFKAKLRYALALLFPTPDFMRVHYGLSSRSQVALHYLTRVCSFALEGIRGVAALLLHFRAAR